MASRCCGSRLSLPNQYDTKTPRARTCWRLLAAAFSVRPFVAHPETRPGRYSRHDCDLQRGFLKILRRFPNFAKRKILKNSSELPTAGPCLPNLSEVFENVTSARARRKPYQST